MKLKMLFTPLLLCALTLSSMAQENVNILKVKGIAEVKTTPSLMRINIPLTVKDIDYQTTTTKLTQVFNDLTKALTKTGIAKESIKSGNLRIAEDYNYVDRERVLVGYIGTIHLNIELTNSPENLHKVMKTLNDQRFKFGYNVSFSLSESQKDSLRKEAIEKAVVDAKQKAAILANAMDVKIGEIQEINFEYGDAIPSPLTRNVTMRYAAKLEDASAEQIELNPDEITLTKSVDIVWEIIQSKP